VSPALLALILIASPPPPDPRLAGMDTDGWEMVQKTAAGIFTLTRPALGDQIPGYPQVWIRTERLGAPPETSALLLLELDCVGRRMRPLEGYGYDAKNLQGDKRPLFKGKKAWRAVSPGTLAKPVLANACAGQ
jgi:hypothetical protein